MQRKGNKLEKMETTNEELQSPERQFITKPAKNRIFSSLKPLLLRQHTQGFVTIRR